MTVIRTLIVTLSLDEDHQDVTDALDTLSDWVINEGAEIVAQYACFDPAGADDDADDEESEIMTLERQQRDEPEIFSLSDCINADTNPLGDCGGRVERLEDGIVWCETCRNRLPHPTEPEYGTASALKYNRI